jgi:hypothetical protein
MRIRIKNEERSFLSVKIGALSNEPIHKKRRRKNKISLPVILSSAKSYRF